MHEGEKYHIHTNNTKKFKWKGPCTKYDDSCLWTKVSD